MTSLPSDLMAIMGQLSVLDLFDQMGRRGFALDGPVAATSDEQASAVRARVMSHLIETPYQIRPAVHDDLPALMLLEQRCWASSMQTAAEVISSRIARYASGQRVMVFEDQIIGVIYTQRIRDDAQLTGVTQYTVDALHDPCGQRAQLLAINLDPTHQQRGWGDQLLEHILNFYALTPDVSEAVALTRCKRFEASSGLSMAQYIALRTPSGVLADPVLRFHELHGATIVQPVSNYRPGDVANAGYGVLVHYELNTRKRHEVSVAQSHRDHDKKQGLGTAAWLTQAVAQLLQVAPAEISPKAPLMELGLDSADLLVLQESIIAQTGLPIQASFLFEHNTVERLSQAIEAQAGSQTTPATSPSDVTNSQEPIAIIGMACRLPGAIESPDDFWAALLRGDILISTLPMNRWQWPEDIDPDLTHRGIDRGGFLSDIAAFDAGLFRISPVEAQSMDPQQRLMLTLSWEVFEQAGYDPQAFGGTRTGVFVGASGSDYAHLCLQSGQAPDAHFGTGSSMAILANRISHFHDLQGPSLVVDTACSSSLVAVHEAIRSIRRGESDQALVGGVNVMCHWANSAAYYQAGMLSADGLCHSFDRQANGYVRGEGAAMVLLKPLSAAQRDGDHVYAVLMGSACHHGGQASGLTVPKPDGQAHLLASAWQGAGVSPGQIRYLEAHGTGTRLGDPIEVEGIVRARGQAGDLGPCVLGAVKANIGHLEAAAGIAGLIKTVLVLQHQQVPSQPDFGELNPQISLDGQLYVAGQEATTSFASDIQYAGVSSFGSGGTNAHVVLAAAPGSSTTSLPSRVIGDRAEPETLLLSARTPEALRELAQRYVAWLETSQSSALPLNQIADLLRHGRHPFEHRITLQAASHGQWQARLRERLLYPDISDAQNQGSEVVSDRKPASLKRFALPCYPFEASRFWLPGLPVPEPLNHVSSEANVYAPLWEVVDGVDDAALVTLDPPALIIRLGGDERWDLSAFDRVPQIRLSGDGSTWDSPEVVSSLSGMGRQRIWVFLDSMFDVQQDQPQQARWPVGVCFEMIKRLLRFSGVELTLLTQQACAMSSGDRANPVAAALHGLFLALSQEKPDWQVRCLDWTSAKPVAIGNGLSVPSQSGPDTHVWRDGHWWHRRFIACELQSASGKGIWRQGGTYVLVGGSGGIGQVLTRRLLVEYAAHVIWIGRRASDELSLKAQGAQVNHHGSLTYYQADAAQGAELMAVMRKIRSMHGPIDGLLHLAVGETDEPLSEAKWSGVERVLRAKMDASIHLVQALPIVQADFLLFFSSVIALEAPGGYAGYAAGGAFQDALAWMTLPESGATIRTVNWGHWSIGTAVTLTEATRTRLFRQGVRPIGIDDAFRAMDVCVKGDYPQLACLAHMRPQSLRWISTQTTLHGQRVEPFDLVCPEPTRALKPEKYSALANSAVFATEVLDAAIKPLLASLLAAHAKESTVSTYAPWLSAAHAWLSDITSVESPERAWRVWQDASDVLSHRSASLKPALALVQTCLSALQDVLTGKRLATDVLFPEASMAMVQSIYQDSPTAEYFNAVLAQTLLKWLTQQQTFGQSAFRILEIGAGTGGTTATVLPALMPILDRIEQYHFSDVSKAFLFHAQQRFGADFPCLTTGLLDITEPIQSQDIQAFDVVLATNVLHATPDLERTLNHVKQLLKPGGLLLLNEVNQVSLFAHVTFGLLSGWWLTKDPERRLANSPLLDSARWQQLLRRCGFEHVGIAAQSAEGLGQQVLFGLSNGLYLRTIRPVVADVPVSAADLERQPTVQDSGKSEVTCQTDSLPVYGDIARRVVADVLRMPEHELSMREPLKSYGLDSILIVQITARLRELVPNVSSTLLFECQTLDEVASQLSQSQSGAAVKAQSDVQMITPNQSPKPPVDEPRGHDAPANAPALMDEPIAIVGMALRLPQARTADAFWDLLANGRHAVTDIPEDRWSLDDFYTPDPDDAVSQGKSYCRSGAFLDDVKGFDPQFFSISPKEALAMDPQERLFLQTSWHALEQAGYSRDRLLACTHGRVGVFVGITRTGFDLFGPPLWAKGQRVYPHTSFSSVANRLSYFLNVHGPSVPVDTMCSSSLTAVHQACQSLRTRECEMAIVGGVNVYLHPSSYVSLSAMRMLSPDGVCRTFGEGANGFVPGEGVVALVLKPLSRAQADGDRIEAIIRATGVNHGGRTNGYTVPNPNAQAELVRTTLDRAGIDARDISYVEAHGTGTALGDPIEITGLSKAFAADTADTGYCAIGSVKTNLGHLEAAAGIAGLAKVVLQLQHRQLVPSLHAEHPNKAIPFEQTPFRVQSALSQWQRAQRLINGQLVEIARIATVSSFGAGGANAYVVLRESGVQSTQSCNRSDTSIAGPWLIVLSARHDKQLTEVVSNLLDDLRAGKFADESQMAALAYTLQVGRQAQDCRLGFVAQSVEHLGAVLKGYLAQQDPSLTRLHQARTRDHRDVIEALDESAMQASIQNWCQSGQYDRVLTLWTKGLPIRWWDLYGANAVWPQPTALALTGYPFDSVQCWFAESGAQALSPSLGTSLGTSLRPPSPPPSASRATPSTLSSAVVKPVAPTAEQSPGRAPITLSNLKQKTRVSPVAAPTSSRAAVELRMPGKVTSAPIWTLTLDSQTAVAKVTASEPQNALTVTGLSELLTTLSGFVDQVAKDGPVPLAVLNLPQTMSDELDWAASDWQSWQSHLQQLRLLVVMRLQGTVTASKLRLAGSADWVASVGAPVLTKEALSDEGLTAWRRRRFGGGPQSVHLGLPFDEAEHFEVFLAEWASQVREAEPQAVGLLLNRLRQERQWAMEIGCAVSGGQISQSILGPSAQAICQPDQPVPLQSAVVTLRSSPSGVWWLQMHDREAKNTSSAELVAGLTEAFDCVDNSDACRVLVMSGFDGYFACGGTKEGLLSIQAGQTRFTDEQTYSRPLFCDVPVIAAMQGHGLGAGWALGLYADYAIYAQSAHYQAPYMRYGFTPGAGSSAIFGHKLGHDLACCVLMSAQTYRGQMLSDLGLQAPVMPAADVCQQALQLASLLATKSRATLVQRKRERVLALRKHLPEVFDAELALHEQTFVGQSHVLERVQAHFTEPVSAASGKTTAVSPMSDKSVVLNQLRASLAQELFLRSSEIDEQTPFMALGLDSIVAVTWVKTINHQFGTTLNATDVYSYPTLEALSTHVVTLQPPQALQAQTPKQAPKQAPKQTQAPARAAVAGSTIEATGATIYSPAANKTAREKAGADEVVVQGVRQALVTSLAEELLLPASAIEPTSPFVDLGLDSIVAVTWVKKINQQFGLELKATDVYSYPDTEQLAKHVATLGSVAQEISDRVKRHHAQVVPASPGETVEYPADSPVHADTQPVQATSDQASSAAGAMAIIGMAGRFPQSDSVQALWDNILQQRDCVSDIPRSLWDIDAYHCEDRGVAGKTVCRRMGYLAGRDLFDPLFFNISPSEAELMDPQQRIFLQTSWHCIEDAGYNPLSLAGSKCGVFVGCAVSDYHQGLSADYPSAQALIGESVSILPARVSYFLDLQGPCLAVDTACSSSLVAFASACDSLASGQSDLALAGGVYLINRPEIHIKMSQAGMLSPDGTCFAFDERANGFVPGEGVGVVLLKRLEDAQRDGDDIYAVVRGWGVNQDGKTNGITAPNRLSQARLERSVYERFHIDPSRIGLIEAHGTGTKLGDPIEIQALCDAFRGVTEGVGYCAVGSVKSNIGHLATAAGITGVIKAAMALRHRIKPASIQHKQLNPHIDLQGSPFYVVRDNEPWPLGEGVPDMAAVSSFGFSGTNAHVVLQADEWREPASSTGGDPVVVPLSSGTNEQLEAAVEALAQWLGDEKVNRVPLLNLAHTLETGRHAFECRVAFVVDSHAMLRTLLSQWLQTEPSKRTTVIGLIDVACAKQAQAWVESGSPMPSNATTDQTVCRRVAGLPGYVFAQERYWLGAHDEVQAPVVQWQVIRGADSVDWQASLGRLTGQVVCVGGLASGLRDAVVDLGRQLSQQIKHGAPFQIKVVDSRSIPSRHPLIWFSQSDEQLPDHDGLIWAVTNGSRLNPETLRWHDQTPSQEGCCKVSVDPSLPVSKAAQALWREWLMHLAQATSYRHVHLDAQERWQWIPDAERLMPSGSSVSDVHVVTKAWQPQSLAQPVQWVGEGTALVLVNRESIALGRVLRDAGLYRRMILVGSETAAQSGIQNIMPLDDPTSVGMSARILADQYADLRCLIDLSDLSTQSLEVDTAPDGKVVLYQALIESCSDLQILHVTRGIHAPTDKLVNARGLQIASLVTMLSAEYPNVTSRTIDMDESALVEPHSAVELIRAELASDTLHASVAYLAGQRSVPTYVATAVEQSTPALVIDPSSWYLVTGGTRGIGLALAHHLIDLGCQHLVLVGLSSLPPLERWADVLAGSDLAPAIRQRLESLVALRQRVQSLQVWSLDLADSDALRERLERLSATGVPLRGVIHAAGRYPDFTRPGFINKPLASMLPVWYAKVRGFENLIQNLRDMPLSFFLTVTSASGMFPGLGKGASDYAMANGAVALYTQQWQTRLPQMRLIALCWPDWLDVGELSRMSAVVRARITETFEELGMRMLSQADGCRLFDLAVAGAYAPLVCFSSLDVAKFNAHRQRLAQPALGQIVRESVQLEDTNRDDVRVHVDRWEAQKRAGDQITPEMVSAVIGPNDLGKLPAALVHRIHRLLFTQSVTGWTSDNTAKLRQLVREAVIAVLKLKSLDDAKPLQDYGLDSISAMLLATRLEKALACKVLPQWLIDHPTVNALATFLHQQNAGSAALGTR